MPDTGLTHVALTVSNLDKSAAFYEKYARMKVVHRRAQHLNPELEIGWLSDFTRPFVLVLAEMPQIETPLGPFAHLGVACASREEVDRLSALAREDGVLRDAPSELGHPVGYIAMLNDPDGHTLELSYGQETGLAVASAQQRGGGPSGGIAP